MSSNLHRLVHAAIAAAWFAGCASHGDDGPSIRPTNAVDAPDIWNPSEQSTDAVDAETGATMEVATPTEPDAGSCGDTDFDLDGIPDCSDGCPMDGTKVEAGACGCGVADTDSDGDSIFDCNDGCPADGNKAVPGACGCGQPDSDGDGDGVVDCDDGCPTDPNKTEAGACGCGEADVDSDGDTVLDCDDGCPLDTDKTSAGTCGCGQPDTDGQGNPITQCSRGIDGSFGVRGEFTFPSPLGNDLLRSAVTAPDGSIFLVGDFSNGTDTDVLLMKLTSDGVLDTGFAGTGFIAKGELAGGTARADQGHSVSLSTDGNLLVGGKSVNATGTSQAFVWKVSLDGVDAPDFGSGGVFLLDASFPIGQIIACAPDPTSGNIFIVGASGGASAWRVLADGSGLDTSFATDGHVNLGSSAIQPRLAVDTAGHLYVAASAPTPVGSRRDGVSWHVDPNGAVVPAYGNPRIHADVAGPGVNDSWRAVVVYGPDKLLLLGASTSAAAADNEVIARVHIADGSSDASFGAGNGIWTEDVLGIGALGRVNAAVVEPDGSIVVALEVIGATGNFDAAVIKLDANGNRLTDYGTASGVLLFGGELDERSPRLVRQPSGRKLLLTTRVDDSGSDVAVWALR